MQINRLRPTGFFLAIAGSFGHIPPASPWAKSPSRSFPADPATLLDDIPAPAAPIGLFPTKKDPDVDHGRT
jgi:hypothetical protein